MPDFPPFGARLKDLAAMAVHPVQPLALNVPERTLAQAVLGIDQQTDFHHETVDPTATARCKCTVMAARPPLPRPISIVDTAHNRAQQFSRIHPSIKLQVEY